MNLDWDAILTNLISFCISIAWRLLAAAVVFLIGTLLIRLLLKFFPNGKKMQGKMDETVRIFLYNLINIALHCVLAVTIVAILGVPMASVITVLAAAGAAIALAVQGSFSNLMGGIMLLIFKPIKVGEAVKIADESGVVTEVGFFYTQLKTFDNVHVSIPNGTMTSSVITNYSREDIRRVDMTFDVAYGTDLEKAKTVLHAVLDSNENALKDPEPFVRMTNFKESSIEITVRVWVKASDYASMKCDLAEACNHAFQKMEIEIPYKQVDVNIKTVAPKK
ncbi:MAG: mechanosensitive ion channel [Clostridia bacterium]|nr:mechanosensitive ion channel [Clostridia bacterium]